MIAYINLPLYFVLLLSLIIIPFSASAEEEIVEEELDIIYKTDEGTYSVTPAKTSTSPDNKIILKGKSSTRPSILRSIILYIPNRVFDLLDIFRLRVRIGPGVGVGIRATKPLSLYAGAHTALYAGLPGPRQYPTIPLPVGAEAVAGGQLSLLDGIFSVDTSSRHSSTEVGLEFQAALVGLDVGIDPLEVIDFMTGFFFLEIREDDI